MSATEQPLSYDEYVVEEPDRVSRILRYVIVFLILMVLSVLLYALVVGVFAPPAPRTLIESSLAQAEGAIKKNSGDGAAWAKLAAAQWAAGDKSEAWTTLEQGRKKVKDASILAVNVQTLSFLSEEGKDAEIVKRAPAYIKSAAKFKTAEIEKNYGKGITPPADLLNNKNEIQLLIFQAGALGNLGKWKEAAKALDYAASMDLTAADVLILRGWARLRSGNKAGAKQDFTQALKFLPGEPSATRGLKEANETTSSK